MMLFKSLFFTLFIVSILLSACEVKCSLGESSANRQTGKYKPVQQAGAVIYNGIRLKTKHLQLSKAYLVTNDNGDVIGDDNFVDINRGIKLILLVDSGWQEKDNKVSLGASMTAIADKKQKLVDYADMFGENQQLSVEDAKIIGLSLYFDTRQESVRATIEVSFRVWDKHSEAYVEGSYTVHTK